MDGIVYLFVITKDGLDDLEAEIDKDYPLYIKAYDNYDDAREAYVDELHYYMPPDEVEVAKHSDTYVSECGDRLYVRKVYLE